MFDEKDRNKLYDSLKTKEGVKKFFESNREKTTNDRKRIEKVQEEIEHLQGTSDSLKMLGLASATVGMKMGELFRDTLDLLEISFLHKIETQEEFKELVSILQEKGVTQESKLNELGKKLDKHDPALEWIDNYFKRSSETSNE